MRKYDAIQIRRMARFRTNAERMGVWDRVAADREQTFSEFARNALNAATVGLVDQEDLRRHLLQMRSILNACPQLRTDEQRMERVQMVLQHINRLLRYEPINE